MDQSKVRRKLGDRLGDRLGAEEEILLCEPFGLKVSRSSVAASTAAAFAIGVGAALVTGGSAVAGVVLPAGWCVVTDQRMLVFTKVTGLFRNPFGTALFEAPVAALTLDGPTGKLNTVTVRDRGEGTELLQVKSGVSSRRTRALVDAVASVQQRPPS
ncbi:hypothetical protein GCM10011519_27640 [Marmoricola endophyticus]|uniref:PH domain-containing protein n=1 Tax=Marmoricola endophyticus TaxID=2040280 RepID=A0A917BPL2_9ACTN|nr:hypothetical protein [Marmoricola endophyticus]GGF52105.1 hypothetical protein GCM10011519_27640 [Marmoricola endophyticus]